MGEDALNPVEVWCQRKGDAGSGREVNTLSEARGRGEEQLGEGGHGYLQCK